MLKVKSIFELMFSWMAREEKYMEHWALKYRHEKEPVDKEMLLIKSRVNSAW